MFGDRALSVAEACQFARQGGLVGLGSCRNRPGGGQAPPRRCWARNLSAVTAGGGGDCLKRNAAATLGFSFGHQQIVTGFTGDLNHASYAGEIPC